MNLEEQRKDDNTNLEVNVESLNKRGVKTQAALIPFLSETTQFFLTLGRMFDCFFFCQFSRFH